VAVVAPRIALAMTGILVLLAGCANPGRPPVADHSPVFSPRPANYLVRRGDTLYSIAWRYELDFAGLARANGLRAPYTIYPGQSLRLRVQLSADHAPPAAAPVRAAVPRPAAAARATTLSWAWPVSAPVLRTYSNTRNGVDFRLEAGDRVRTAAAGEVVYAGNGLGGYEHLVIVKHNERYLSAYSLNTTSTVREGERIEAGAKLADIPGSSRAALTLHFEIRRDGEAVNPKTVIK
jgi:lipoprotein NlpD